jgi:hypothetical protein
MEELNVDKHLEHVDKLHKDILDLFSELSFFAEEYETIVKILKFIEGFINKKIELETEVELEQKKISHDYYATIAQILLTKPFKLSELSKVVNAINFCKEMTKILKVEIEKLDPKSVELLDKKEEKQTLEMDLTHLNNFKSEGQNGEKI